MNFSENTNLMPGGQSASPSKVKELENRIDDLQQTVTSVADSVADLSDEVNTSSLNVLNAVIDNATVGSETVSSADITDAEIESADITGADITNADITNAEIDEAEITSLAVTNEVAISVNSVSYTGQNIHVSDNIQTDKKLLGADVETTNAKFTNAEVTDLEIKGNTTARGDVYFPENGDKIYGEYLEVDANKVKVKSLTTETPTGSSQLVGYDANGNLIPVDAGLDPGNYWENVPHTDPDEAYFIKPKDNKSVQAPVIHGTVVYGQYAGFTQRVESAEVGGTTVRAVESLTVDEGGETTLRDTEVDGDLTVNGDIIQNGSAYETHAEKLYTKKDIIITRDGAVSALSAGDFTGIQATKYDGTNDGQLVFDKDGEARVGDVGDTQPLLTRDEIADLTNGNPLVWDATNKKAVSGTLYGKIYKDLDTLNADKGTAIELISGEDNCSKIVEALNANEVFSDYFDNSLSNTKWGIGSSSGTSYVLIRFEKLASNYCIISAYETDTNTEYFRVSKAGTLGAWQKNAKQTDLDSYTVHRVFSGYSNNNNIITFTLEDGGTYECRMYYFGGLCGIYGLARNIFGPNGAKISTVWAGSFQSYSISVNEDSGVVSMTGTGADNVLFDIYKL